MNSAKWSSGNHSSGDGGSRNACLGEYGRNVLLTPSRDHIVASLSIPSELSSARSEARTDESFYRDTLLAQPAVKPAQRDRDRGRDRGRVRTRDCGRARARELNRGRDRK